MSEQTGQDGGDFEPMPLLAVLERHGVQHVVVGGYAAVLHGATRPTRDVDVAPASTPENLTRLAAALTELGARIRTEAEPAGLPFAASAESLAGVQMLNLQTELGELDLTFQPAATGGYPALNRTAETHQVGEVQVRVAALADVIRSKEAAGRDKDFDAPCPSCTGWPAPTAPARRRSSPDRSPACDQSPRPRASGSARHERQRDANGPDAVAQNASAPPASRRPQAHAG